MFRKRNNTLSKICPPWQPVSMVDKLTWDVFSESKKSRIFEGKIGNVMKYLGINIACNLQEIIKINLDRLKTEINGRIKEYQQFKDFLTW